MPATIKDIAKALNISVSTVSYALNGGPRSVPERVKLQVLDTAKTLGYRPNRTARSLITGKTHVIGVVPSSLEENIALAPYFQQSFNGIINRAESLKYDVMLFTRFDQEETEPMLNDLLGGRADAFIFLAPRVHSRVLRLIAELEIPYVVTGSESFPEALCFNSDNVHGVTVALDHLTELGHTKIGHISGLRDQDDSRVREKAFIDYLQKKGLPARKEWIEEGSFTPIDGYAAGKKILSQSERPTAIFCANDESALGLLRACHELSVRVPEQLSVVGYDDSPLCEYVFPGLTSVRQPIHEMAVEAMSSAVALVEGKEPSSPQLFPTKLIVRASTCSPQEDIS